MFKLRVILFIIKLYVQVYLNNQVKFLKTNSNVFYIFSVFSMNKLLGLHKKNIEVSFYHLLEMYPQAFIKYFHLNQLFQKTLEQKNILCI